MVVKVIKDKVNGDIKTWASIVEIGAEKDFKEFMLSACKRFGSPAFTMTNASLTEGILAACDEEFSELKRSTAAVAAMNLGLSLK